jgi:hypothetical protein
VHGVGFTATCLPISEYANIVSVKGTLNHFSCIVKDFFLGRLLGKYCIILVCLSSVRRYHNNFVVVTSNHTLAVTFQLIVDEGSYAAKHSYIALHIFNLIVQLSSQDKLSLQKLAVLFH